MSLLRADKLANQTNNGGPIIVGPSTVSGNLIVTNNVTSLSIGVTNNVSIGGSLTVDETLSVEKNASIIGSVGIGTTNPLAGLHIKGEGQTTSDISDSGSFDSFLRLSDDANNSGNGGGIIFSTQQGDVAGSAGFAAIKGLLTNSSNNTIGDLAFSTRLSTSDNTLSESLRILSNGSILSNLSTKYNVASFSRTHYISPFMGGSANQIVVGARNNGFPGIFFTKTTGTETNSNDAVSEGNVLGSLQAFGSNDIGFVRTNAKIDFKADEDFSGSPDNTPGRIEFWTCPPLSTSPEERIRITSGGYVGIGSTNPSSKFSVNGNAIISGILTALSFYGDGSNLTGLGDTANVRTDTLVVTGVSTLGVVTGVTAIEATTYYGDGSNLTGIANTENVSTNTLIVSGVSTLSGDVNIGQDLLITRDLQVTRNIYVDGNLTIGGTSATISAETLTITDPDIILGYRTDANGQDISTDDTASHGGVALASTEGSPLINLVGAGETLAQTYKKIMWFKTNSFTGLNTDAWLSNYAFGVGTTSMSSGTKFAVGNIEANFDDFTSVRNINSSGVITATSYVGDGSSLTNVLSDLVDDTTPQLGGDLDLNGNNITGTSNIILTGIGKIGIGTDTPDTPLDVRTSSTLPAQFVTKTGSSNGAIIRLRKNDTNLSNNDKIGVIQFAGDNGTDSYISEISKIESVVTDATFGSEDGDLTFFTSTNGSSTEKVRINSSGNVGIATENPEHKLHVIGDARITGILTIGTSSLTLDGINDSIQVGSALTIGHSIGLQFHSQSIHSNGMNALDINATGVITATSFVGDGSGLTNVGGGDTSHIVADTFVVTGFSTFKGSGTEVLRITQDVNASVQQEFGIGFAANPNHTNSAALITFEEFDTSDSRGDLVFYTRGTNSDSSPTERLRIDSSGNIGIGTNNPIYGLDVRGTGNIARFGKPNSTDDSLLIDVSNSGYPKLYNPSSADTLSLVSTGSVQVSIDSNNNDTTKAFTVVSNGHSGSGTELFKINESGDVNITGVCTATSFVGTASTATTVTVTPNGDNTTYRVPFTSGTTGDISLYTDTSDGMTYNPSTNTLVAGNFSGNGSNLTSVDADTVDTLHASSFLRSDANDTATGALTIGNAVYSNYTSADTDITGLVAGSTFGSLIEGQTNAHLVVGVRGNDVSDSFSVVSGSGNYVTDSTYDKLVFQAKADGTLTANGGNTIWHGGNDGSGSGLDADLLDGVQGSSFLRSDADTTKTSGQLLLNDSVPIRFGTGADAQMFHNGSDMYFDFQVAGDSWYFRDSSDSAIFGFEESTGNLSLYKGSVLVGDGGDQSTVQIKKADNNVSDHIQFYNGTTRMGEIGCQDTTWLRINQVTTKNIYTPRYIRADGGFFVDGATKGINGDGNFVGGTIAGASDYGSLLRSNATDSFTGTITNSGNFISLADSASAANFNKIRLGRSTTQFMSFFGDSGGSNMIAVSSSGNPKANVKVGYSVDGGATVANTYTFTGSSGTVWTSGNDGSGSGLDADTLDGVQPSVTAGNNTIVKRHSSGYIYANYFNTTPNDVTSGVTRICCETGNDGFIRHATQAAVRVFIGAGSGNGLDADTVDGVQGGSFLRSDANDTATGAITFNGRVNIRGHIDLSDNEYLYFGSGDDVEMFCNGSHMYMDLNSGIGNFYIRDGSTTRFTFNDNGNFTATGNITAYSDINLKKNIEVIPDALNKVSQLRGVTFDRIDIEDEPRQSGVIAQEVEKVLPEVVGTTEDGTKTVAYGNMVGLLIEAIKEQQKQIDDLKAKLKDVN